MTEYCRQLKSCRECQLFSTCVVRRALLLFLLLVAVPVQAAEPIRLQVIPYRERPQAIPVLPYLFLPPPPLLEQTKPRKRRRNSGRDQVWEDDFDWLMD